MGAYDMHNAECSSEERTRRTQWACLKPVSLLDCLFIYLIHMLLLCVCAFLLYRDKEASCSTTLAELGCEAA